MRCIAIDDEPIALSIISNFCQRNGQIQLTTFSNPLEGINAIKEENPDLVFLDIEMNDLSGLDVARQLPEDCILIFTTAHANYALDGYEVNAVDFLHKPFSYDRFCSAISRARQILTIIDKAKSIDTVENTQLTLKVEYQNVTIAMSNILYIESMDNYIKIHTCDNRKVLTQMSIKSILKLLPEEDFLRIHRSFVVSKANITSFTKRQIQLLAGDSILLPVGRIYAEELYKTMFKCNSSDSNSIL